MGVSYKLAEQLRSQDREIDLLIELYCDWRTASADVRRAYESYRCAQAADRTVAFAAYGAALDREQAASDNYAFQIGQLGLLLECSGHPLAIDAS